MHRILIYVNSIGQQVILGKKDIIVTESDILDYEWKYNRQYKTILSTKHSEFVENKIELVCVGKTPKETADNLFRVIDYDAANKTMGKLYLCEHNQIKPDKTNYYRRGFFRQSKKINFHYKNFEEIEFTFLSDEDIWSIENTTEFNISASTFSLNNNLDYPYDYSHDFTTMLNRHQLINTNYIDTEFRLTIYGPAMYPNVNVNHHSYKVDVELKNNEYLVIDSVEKKITKHERLGNLVNVFNLRGKEDYIFEKMPPGTSPVTWNSDFKFDITLIEQRGEPKWI